MKIFKIFDFSILYLIFWFRHKCVFSVKNSEPPLSDIDEKGKSIPPSENTLKVFKNLEFITADDHKGTNSKVNDESKYEVIKLDRLNEKYHEYRFKRGAKCIEVRYKGNTIWELDSKRNYPKYIYTNKQHVCFTVFIREDLYYMYQYTYDYWYLIRTHEGMVADIERKAISLRRKEVEKTKFTCILIVFVTITVVIVLILTNIIIDYSIKQKNKEDFNKSNQDW